MSRKLAITGVLAGALLLAVHSLPAIAETENAEQVVRRAANEIIAVLSERELPVSERRERIRQIAEAHFDTETIARLVLARHWRRFSPEQRVQFEDEMKRHILVSYGDRIDYYDQEKLEVLSERAEARGDVTVRTRLIGGEADGVAVDYRLRRRDERWLVIDVVVEGVSVIKSYRSQFQERLGSGTPEELLEELRTKNAEAADRSGTSHAEDAVGPATGQADG